MSSRASIVRSVAVHDWTSVPVARGLRTIERLRRGDVEPLADRAFTSEVEVLTTEEQRRETGERLRRLRRAS